MPTNILEVVFILFLFFSFCGIFFLIKNWFPLHENILPRKKKYIYIIPFLILFNDFITEEGQKYRNGVVKGLLIFLLSAAIAIAIIHLEKK